MLEAGGDMVVQRSAAIICWLPRKSGYAREELCE